MTDFETKLKKILDITTHNDSCIAWVNKNECNCWQREGIKDIKTLVADTLLKAIGEQEDTDMPTQYLSTETLARIDGQNQLRSEIKSKVFEMLGIKEKSL